MPNSLPACVTRGREDDIVDAGEVDDLEGVVFHVHHIGFGEFLHGFQGVWTLHGQLSPFFALVLEVFAKGHAELLGDLAHPSPVLVDVGGVGHHEVVVVGDAVNEHVVHDAALAVRQAGVLHLAVAQGGHVVDGAILHELLGHGAFGAELAHVAYVEYTDVVADVVMLFDEAGVLDRHVVTSELSHLGAQVVMDLVVRSFL